MGELLVVEGREPSCCDAFGVPGLRECGWMMLISFFSAVVFGVLLVVDGDSHSVLERCS